MHKSFQQHCARPFAKCVGILLMALVAQVCGGHAVADTVDTHPPQLITTQTSRGVFVVEAIDTGEIISGLDSLFATVGENMRLTSAPFDACTRDTVRAMATLIDTLRGGALTLHAKDCAGNDQHVTLIPSRDPLDTLPPFIDVFHPTDYFYEVKISDRRIHDSGVKSYTITRLQNYQGLSIKAPAPCDTAILAFSFSVLNPDSASYFHFSAMDCAGNIGSMNCDYAPKLESGIDESATPHSDDIFAAPNPFTTGTVVQGQFAAIGSSQTVHVCSVMGEDVTSSAGVTMEKSGSVIRVRMSGATLPAGMYLVSISNGSQRLWTRVALMK